MIDLDHLTTREKIMHAEKVGRVPPALRSLKIAVSDWNIYTLCAQQAKRSHDRNRLKMPFSDQSPRPAADIADGRTCRDNATFLRDPVR